MRLPLIRRANDETPFRWWEWMLAPFVMPLLFLVLAIAEPLSFLLCLVGKSESGDRLVAGLAALGLRLPLVSRGNDETPPAWWEWLFAPIVMPLNMAVFLVVAVFAVPVTIVYQIRSWREERKLALRLADAGRWMDWADVESKLMAGEGSLIIQVCSVKGPVRIWWTKDDVIAASPVPLPDDLQWDGQQQQLRDYAKSCIVKYLDVESGRASLTEVPRSLWRTDKLLDIQRRARVVRFDEWMGPLLTKCKFGSDRRSEN